MIHVEHITRSFGRVQAVSGISFDIAKGEVVGLLGPNGAGKTTTMRIITGYISPDGGNVTIDGIPVSASPEKARRLIGYLPENAPVYPDMEVTAFLGYIARLRGVVPGKIKTKISEMIGTCGLEAVVGRPIGALSKGYRQRVGLAQAMIHEPPVLILDEPTSGLDPNQIVEIRNLIRDIGRDRTVMLSTHILQEVEATCSRSIIINNGRLVGEGTLSELATHTEEAALYVVSLRAPKEEVDKYAAELAGLELIDNKEEDGKRRLVLKGSGGVDRSEDIFSWIVRHGWSLAELKKEKTSLEDVFRELTAK